MNAWGTGWFHNDTIFDGSQEHGYNETEYRNYYIAAPCIEIVAGIKNRLMLGNGVNLYVRVYKYNGTGFPGDPTYQKSVLAELSDYDFKYITFRHNYNSGDLTDNSDTHLWKVQLQWSTGSWPSRCAMELHVRCGGIGCVPNNSTYNYMWKTGSKLYACPCDYWNTSSYSSDLAFVSANRPEAFTGQKIMASDGYMAYSVRE